MLALMNDQKQQSNAQGYSARRASMPQREPAVSTANNSPGVVKAADRFESQCAAELAPSNKCSCSPSCTPSAPRCNSSIVAVSSSTAGLSSAEFSSNSNYSPPSPPLLPRSGPAISEPSPPPAATAPRASSSSSALCRFVQQLWSLINCWCQALSLSACNSSNSRSSN
uniref:Uncharacterized protein n=1 Tax=Macrostomum lignano TaxID=282301 RepID=A0A1I8H2C2_9PLAT